jgi:hypothetical protein
MSSNKLEVSVTFDARRGYVATAAELKAPELPEIGQAHVEPRSIVKSPRSPASWHVHQCRGQHDDA